MAKAASQIFDLLRNEQRELTPVETSQCTSSQENTVQGVRILTPGTKLMKKSTQKPIHNKQPVDLERGGEEDTQIRTGGRGNGILHKKQHYLETNQEQPQRSKNLPEGNDVALEQNQPQLLKRASTGIKSLDKLRRKSAFAEQDSRYSNQSESDGKTSRDNNLLHDGAQFITPDNQNHVHDKHHMFQNNLGAGQIKKIFPSGGNNESSKQNSNLTANQQQKRGRGRPRKNAESSRPLLPPSIKRTSSRTFIAQGRRVMINRREISVAKTEGDTEPDPLLIVNRDNTKMASSSESLSSEDSSEVQVSGAFQNSSSAPKIKQSTGPSTEKHTTSEEQVYRQQQSKEMLSKSSISSSNESSNVSIKETKSVAKLIPQQPIISNMSSPLQGKTDQTKINPIKMEIQTSANQIKRDQPVQQPKRVLGHRHHPSAMHLRRKMTQQSKRKGSSSSSSSSSSSKEGFDDFDHGALKEPKPQIVIHQDEDSISSESEESKVIVKETDIKLKQPQIHISPPIEPLSQTDKNMIHQSSISLKQQLHQHDVTDSPNIMTQHLQINEPLQQNQYHLNQRKSSRGALSLGRLGVYPDGGNMSPSRFSQFDIHKEFEMIEPHVNQNSNTLYDIDQEPNNIGLYQLNSGDGYIFQNPSSTSLLYPQQSGTYLNSSSQARPSPLMLQGLRSSGGDNLAFNFNMNNSSCMISPRPRRQSDLSNNNRGSLGDFQFNQNHLSSSQYQQHQMMYNFDISGHHQMLPQDSFNSSHGGPVNVSPLIAQSIGALDTILSPRSRRAPSQL